MKEIIKFISIFVLGLIVGFLFRSCTSKTETPITKIVVKDTIYIHDTITIHDTVYFSYASSIKAWKCDSLIFNTNIDFEKLDKIHINRKYEYNFQMAHMLWPNVKTNINFTISPIIAYNFQNKSIFPILNVEYNKFSFLISRQVIGIGIVLRW